MKAAGYEAVRVGSDSVRRASQRHDNCFCPDLFVHSHTRRTRAIAATSVIAGAASTPLTTATNRAFHAIGVYKIQNHAKQNSNAQGEVKVCSSPGLNRQAIASPTAYVAASASTDLASSALKIIPSRTQSESSCQRHERAASSLPSPFGSTDHRYE